MAIEINSGSVVGRAVGSLRQQHWLSLMLLALHGALVLELTDPLARARRYAAVISDYTGVARGVRVDAAGTH